MADVELVIKIPEEIAGGRSANVSGLLNKERQRKHAKGDRKRALRKRG